MSVSSVYGYANVRAVHRFIVIEAQRISFTPHVHIRRPSWPDHSISSSLSRIVFELATQANFSLFVKFTDAPAHNTVRRQADNRAQHGKRPVFPLSQRRKVHLYCIRPIELCSGYSTTDGHFRPLEPRPLLFDPSSSSSEKDRLLTYQTTSGACLRRILNGSRRLLILLILCIRE